MAKITYLNASQKILRHAFTCLAYNIKLRANALQYSYNRFGRIYNCIVQGRRFLKQAIYSGP